MRRGRGAYATVEVNLLREAATEDEGLRGWIRGGTADQDLYPVVAYFGGGLVYTGLVPGRARDQIGVAVAHARLGAPARQAAGSRLEEAETTFELTYRALLSERIALQPDLQYVIGPGGDPTLDDALVIGLRLELGLAR